MPVEVWYLYVNGRKNREFYVTKLVVLMDDGEESLMSYVAEGVTYVARDMSWIKRGKSRVDLLDFFTLAEAKRTVIEWYYEEASRQNKI